MSDVIHVCSESYSEEIGYFRRRSSGYGVLSDWQENEDHLSVHFVLRLSGDIVGSLRATPLKECAIGERTSGLFIPPLVSGQALEQAFVYDQDHKFLSHLYYDILLTHALVLFLRSDGVLVIGLANKFTERTVRKYGFVRIGQKVTYNKPGHPPDPAQPVVWERSSGHTLKERVSHLLAVITKQGISLHGFAGHSFIH